jgi:hypothetical protein
MPQNGEMNLRFGVYQALCCGKEIMVREGDLFPHCPNHPGLTTIWKSTVDDNAVRLGKPQASEYRTPRFAVGDQIIFVGLGPKSGKQGDVIEVIDGSLDYVHRYHVRLSDGTWIRCFGFELEFDLTSSKSA